MPHQTIRNVEYCFETHHCVSVKQRLLLVIYHFIFQNNIQQTVL
jgi:hypothetical protein